jgi:MYXO-CTERM domain-containing protein
VLVELYDADLGLYMDEFGPAQSPTLELLPLEDASFDEPAPPVIVVEESGGGAMSLWTLLALLGLAAARRREESRLKPLLH